MKKLRGLLWAAWCRFVGLPAKVGLIITLVLGCWIVFNDGFWGFWRDVVPVTVLILLALRRAGVKL